MFSGRKAGQKLQTIAVKGADRGLGATHLSLCLANALAMTGRVAMLEWNAGNDLAEIEKIFSGFGFQAGNEKMFRIRRVDYYKHYQERGLAGLKKENYDWIIADLGTYAHPYFAEADHPVLVVSGSEWRAGKALLTVKAAEAEVGRRLKVFINFGNQEELLFFQRKSQAQIYNFPFWKDAFSSTKEQREHLSQIFW
ncbi:hypothetical protein EII17_07195 [Clostridiales bacterium COT073_COT-073]|nr:hypothetical protein EII17_07195 [Clostridiales bacterium COT073_COT-073]